jgi:hypothetical protein
MDVELRNTPNTRKKDAGNRISTHSGSSVRHSARMTLASKRGQSGSELKVRLPRNSMCAMRIVVVRWRCLYSTLSAE